VCDKAGSRRKMCNGRDLSYSASDSVGLHIDEHVNLSRVIAWDFHGSRKNTYTQYPPEQTLILPAHCFGFGLGTGSIWYSYYHNLCLSVKLV